MDENTTFNPVLLALGGNISGHMDSPYDQLQDAIARIATLDLHIVTESRVYRTPCFPAGAGPDFVNAALRCDTRLPPDALLHALHAIEAAMGRARGPRWGARVIDIDLLAAGAAVRPDRAGFDHWARLPLSAQRAKAPQQLILPHPRLHERGFVLVPLMDVAPDWVHPVLGRSVRAMHAALDPAARAAITAI